MSIFHIEKKALGLLLFLTAACRVETEKLKQMAASAVSVIRNQRGEKLGAAYNTSGDYHYDGAACISREENPRNPTVASDLYSHHISVNHNDSEILDIHDTERTSIQNSKARTKNEILDLFSGILKLEDTDTRIFIDSCYEIFGDAINFPRMLIYVAACKLLPFKTLTECTNFIGKYLKIGEEKLDVLACGLNEPKNGDVVAMVDSVLVKLMIISNEVKKTITGLSIEDSKDGANITVKIKDEIYQYTRTLIKFHSVHGKLSDPNKTHTFELYNVSFKDNLEILRFVDTFRPKTRLRFIACKFKDMILNFTIEDSEKWQEVESLDIIDCMLFNIGESLAINRKLERLRILDGKLREIPQVVYKMKNLKNLEITGGKIRQIHPELDNFTLLETLNLSHNKIDNLPKEIGKLTMLKSLVLTKNYLTDLPDELSDLPNLRYLELNFNPMSRCKFDFSKLALSVLLMANCELNTFPPSICEMKSIVKLNMSGNNISDIPNTLHNFMGKTLAVLMLRGNSIKEFPSSFQEMDSLIDLSLEENLISNIPEIFKPMKCIKRLGLSNNLFDSVPEYISKLQTLEVLAMCKNRLQKLPAALEKLTNLRKLFISENNFSKFPGVITQKFLKLIKLYINKNMTTPLAISEDIGNLTELEVFSYTNNRTTLLPSSIVNLKKLKTLKINGNNLNEIRADLGKYLKLEVLNLSSNFLSEIPDGIRGMEKSLQKFYIAKNSKISKIPCWLSNFEEIRLLDIGCNEITGIESDLPPNMRVLRLNNNMLVTIPRSVTNTRRLQRLILSNNYIEVIPKEISNLKRVVFIDIGRNRLSVLPEEIVKMRRLEKIKADCNRLVGLPRQIGKMKRLIFLFIGFNNIRILPNSICDLGSLEVLDICNNNIRGLPNEIGRMRSLRYLNIRDNNMYGRLPNSFGDLSELRSFSSCGNRIIGVKKYPVWMNRERKLTTVELLTKYGIAYRHHHSDVDYDKIFDEKESEEEWNEEDTKSEEETDESSIFHVEERETEEREVEQRETEERETEQREMNDTQYGCLENIPELINLYTPAIPSSAGINANPGYLMGPPVYVINGNYIVYFGDALYNLGYLENVGYFWNTPYFQGFQYE